MIKEGKVIKWNSDKGFGIIEAIGYGCVFVSYSQIKTQGFKQLEVGEPVRFDLVKNDKFGHEAHNVIRLAFEDDESTESAEDVKFESTLKFLKAEHSKLLSEVDNNFSKFNLGRIYMMEKLLDELYQTYGK